LKLFNNLICFEFSKYSSCFEVLNQIDTSQSISVFEMSPTPSGGILILTSEKYDLLKDFYQQNTMNFKQTILDSCLIQNLNSEILKAYLSQNKPDAINNLGFFETNSISAAFLFAQKTMQQEILGQIQIVDFRVIRSVHNRCVLVFSGDLNNSNCVVINHPTGLVTSYFQILK
jgi:hypothetical protein